LMCEPDENGFSKTCLIEKQNDNCDDPAVLEVCPCTCKCCGDPPKPEPEPEPKTCDVTHKLTLNQRADWIRTDASIESFFVKNCGYTWPDKRDAMAKASEIVVERDNGGVKQRYSFTDPENGVVARKYPFELLICMPPEYVTDCKNVTFPGISSRGANGSATNIVLFLVAMLKLCFF